MIQSAHVVAKLIAQRGINRRCDESGVNFVVYGVSSEKGLIEIESRLDGSAVSFREPDLGGQLTAVAYIGAHRGEFDRNTLL